MDVARSSLGRVLTVAGADKVALSGTGAFLSIPEEADRVLAWPEEGSFVRGAGAGSALGIVSLRDRKDVSPWWAASRLGRDRIVGASWPVSSVRRSFSVICCTSDNGTGCFATVAVDAAVGFVNVGAAVLDVDAVEVVFEVRVVVVVAVEDVVGAAEADVRGLFWARC